MRDALLQENKRLMLLNVEKLFERIEKNKDTLHMKYVQEDLNKLHLEIARTTQRMGL